MDALLRCAVHASSRVFEHASALKHMLRTQALQALSLEDLLTCTGL